VQAAISLQWSVWSRPETRVDSAFFKESESAATPVAAGKPLNIRPANVGKGLSAKPCTPNKPAKRDAT
jgi:hypothetical protein